MSIIRLEYIESTGTQYINSGFIPNSKSAVKVRLSLNSVADNACIFCARTNFDKLTYSCFHILESGFRFDYYNSQGFTNIMPRAETEHVIHANQNKVYIDGSLGYEHTKASFTAGGPLWLFASYAISGGTFSNISNFAKARMYSCEVYDDGTLVRDFVPAYDSESGNVGLLDRISGILYTSDADNFIAGPQYVESKYLVRSGFTLYTVTDGALVPLSDTEVSASMFRDYGVDDPPDGSLLAGLTDPEVLYWHDSTDDLPALSLTVTGTPPVPQVVVTDAQDMSDSTILGIESVTVTASEDVLWAISFDDGATWKAYNGSQWVTLEQENSGMTAETFQNLSLEAWDEVVTSTTYRLRFVLMTTDSYVSEVVINYIN